ncbi:MAG: ABC transporter ATP-binding protein [Selenomonas sp.]|uniref:ABC transporter ATP-binding protein n=1 Tax=Selenomonas sp. TaxID=2053611 RepID=UPI0025D816C4|nr:ABC transporter ATP-binding protein [Selenomonas sp.]MCR5758562.1 ABC transporter ATP-binding protein [Selenomonas sp.]
MLLDVKKIAIAYQGQPMVEDVSFDLEAGEVLAIVGESGSGKTSVIRAILGCLSGTGKVNQGEILFAGRNLANLSNKEWLSLRGKDIAMIFQDSGNMLNPVQTIGRQFVEYLQLHSSLKKGEAQKKASSLLSRMNLPDPQRVMESYPFELSGGMRQRVGIAMALAFAPKLLLADEPTSALDVTTQAQIVEELMQVVQEAGAAMIIVTHNIGVAAHMADKIMVMSGGRVVEYGATAEVIDHPQAEYTRSLLAAVPEIGGHRYVG